MCDIREVESGREREMNRYQKGIERGREVDID